MAAHYIDLDGFEFEALLFNAGFQRTVQSNEVVYVRAHTCVPNLRIKCYTSLAADGSGARDVGADAIRVVGVLESELSRKSYPIFKGKRIHRTTSQESIHARVRERIADAERRCDEWAAEQIAKRNSLQPRMIEERKEAPAPVSPIGNYFGCLRDEVRRTLIVKEKKPWLDKLCITLQDREHNTFVYWTQRGKENELQVGETYDLGFRIMGHSSFRNVRQTQIANVMGKRVVQ
jgi:hypothetical protein